MMLKLRDFLHLPELDSLIHELISDTSGVTCLAGIQSRAFALQSTDRFSASGLSAFFNILFQEMMFARPTCQAVFILENRALARVPRQISRRVKHIVVDSDAAYQKQIEIAAQQHPGLLVVDQLNSASAPAVFAAARSGVQVLVLMDTVLRGALTGQQLLQLGVSRALLSELHWVVTNQRIPVLCDHCKQPVELTQDIVERVCGRYPALSDKLAAHFELSPGTAGEKKIFFHAVGCEHCHGVGYNGDIAVFDIFKNDPSQVDFFAQTSLISFEEYVFTLAQEGLVDLDLFVNLENDFLRQTYQMLTTSQTALSESNSALQRKLMELEASNRVLVQRTQALMSIQDLGQALIESTDLAELAGRICKRAVELSDADKAVVYLCERREAGGLWTQVLAVRGWKIAQQRLNETDAEALSAFKDNAKAERMTQPPPGVMSLEAKEQETRPTLMGLRIPLIAQEQMVGVMVVQSTQKEFFSQGEWAVLQTFANQAALAIQRAGLVDTLREKIRLLEDAQAELVKKERMEHELDLARQVQQSMLPTCFPTISGFSFAAHNEPARQVGGDFYDVFELDSDHFGLVIADVADKGMPAALYMALTRSLILAEARREPSPRQALLNVNQLLLSLGDLNGFVSVFYGVVEKSTAHLRFVRAGHERPLLLRAGQLFQLDGDGVVLGALDNDSVHLDEIEITLQKDDRFLFYTDGLTDVTDAQGRFSGLNLLKELFSTCSEQTAEQICERIFSELKQYRGGADQFDDMTLLVVQVEE